MTVSQRGEARLAHKFCSSRLQRISEKEEVFRRKPSTLHKSGPRLAGGASNGRPKILFFEIRNPHSAGQGPLEQVYYVYGRTLVEDGLAESLALVLDFRRK